MSNASERSQLGGLARSIDALFTGRAGPEAPAVAGTITPDEEALPPHDSGEGLTEAARLVAALAQERDDERREGLVEECVVLGLPAAHALADALGRTEDRYSRRVYLDALIAMGPASMPVVEGMMDDPRWFVVRNGVAILGGIGGEKAVGLLTGALARPEPKIRRDAVLALVKVGGPDAGQLAYGMLDDPDRTVRIAAASAVGALGMTRALKRLMAILENEDDPDLTVAALHSLGLLGDPAAVQGIERHAVGSFLRRPPPDVRIAAYRALRHIGTPRARRLLNQAVDDRDPAVKAEVRRLLGM
jgi:HEAT repeat protein